MIQSILFLSILFVCSGAFTLNAAPSIVNGNPTSAEAYPFIVDMRIPSIINHSFCTGSLIRLEYPATVLTAAHCLYNLPAPLAVNLLRSDADAPLSNTNNFTSYDAMGYVIHPLYNDSNLDNDVALVFLSDSLENNNRLEVVTLPSSVDVDTECCSIGDSLQVLGYGLDVEGGEGILFMKMFVYWRFPCEPLSGDENTMYI